MQHARELARALASVGVPVWWDDDLVSGDRWERALRARVDGAAALVVLMSPNAEISQWVQLEVGRARYQRRPVRPILLAGEPFRRLEGIQYATIASGDGIPVSKFVDRLREDIAAVAPPPQRRPVIIGSGLPEPNPFFVGREQLLLDLEEHLYWGRSVSVEALQGTGGVGKTQLATEYLRRHRADYDLIAWINAERVELIPAQTAAMAPILGVPAYSDETETARAVVAALTHTDVAWLLVYDNANQPGDLLEWLPRAGAGHVIITSRQSGFEALGSRLDVDVLTPAEAVALLRTRLPDIGDDIASQVVEELGRLPLAVEQAAAFLAETGTPPHEYLDLLRFQGEQLLDQGYARGYEHTVATVWHLSQTSLHLVSPAAEQLLQLCAFLGPEPVPLDLFARHADLLPAPLKELAGDRLRFNAAVGALYARSLARRSSDGIIVHRLLAAAIRRPLATSERHMTIQEIRELLFSHLPGRVEDSPDGWPVWRALLPHVLAATRHDSPHLGESDRTSWLLNRGGSYLQTHGQPRAALPLYEKALRLDEDNLGPADPATLGSRDNVAYAHEAAGQLEQAIPLYEATLLDRIRVLGADAPDTLISGNNLALAYASAGKLNRAIPMFEATLAARARLFGGSHPVTILSRNNLAGAYRASGQVSRAIAVLETAHRDALRTLGADHPETLRSSDQLASAYQSLGKLDKAIELFVATVADRARVLGPDHPNTLNARNNLALAYQAAGKLDEAIALLEASAADRQRVHGPDDPHTLQAIGSLGQAYQAAGQMDKAISLLETSLAERLRVLGNDNPSTLRARNNLAHAYLEGGHLDEAFRLMTVCLSEALRVLGPDSPATFTARNNLATAYQRAGNMAAAVPLFEATLADRIRVLGADHPESLQSRNNVATAYNESGDTDKAVSLLEDLVADCQRVLGSDHPDTLSIRQNLANVYAAAGQVGKAVTLWGENALDALRILGAEHPFTKNVLQQFLGIAAAVREQDHTVAGPSDMP
ncbi:tetratricopeptide repeat protein [Catellatospora sp. NEAU-YM18]|nr:tetratricopeptide repeat protein [Catellatospora tritici]